MHFNFLFLWSIFVVVSFIVAFSLAYYLHTKHPEYLTNLELEKFRDNLIPGVFVKLEHSNLIYKIVLVNDDYVQLHHPEKGYSGHPISTVYPVDYEF